MKKKEGFSSNGLREGVRDLRVMSRPESGVVLKRNPINEVYIPFLKIRHQFGKREWSLSWRPAVEADLRNIWNGLSNLTTNGRGKARQ